MTAEAYRTVSNDALCIITGIIPIHIKIKETAELYKIVRGNRHKNLQIDHDKLPKQWLHPADRSIATDSDNTQELPNSPRIYGITSGIFLRTFNKFPRLVTTIYNQCLKRGCFPRRWKTTKIIPITKPGKEKSMDPSKYRPISLLTIGAKVLEKLLINRINQHMFRNKLLTENRHGFMPQKNSRDAAMEAKNS